MNAFECCIYAFLLVNRLIGGYLQFDYVKSNTAFLLSSSFKEEEKTLPVLMEMKFILSVLPFARSLVAWSFGMGQPRILRLILKSHLSGKSSQA